MEELFDFAGKARELGISEAALRARVLNRIYLPYAYVSNEAVEGTHEEFLPEWSRERFPWVRWIDHGSSYDAYRNGRLDLDRKEHGIPRYTINGWVILSKSVVGKLLADKREVNLHGEYVGINDEITDEVVGLLVSGKSVWIPETDGGGYQDTRGTQLTPSDLYFLPEKRGTPEPNIDSRREKSLLRIIRALDVMASLPPRGAATAIERQLQELGFSGPNDETIRKVIDDARSLPPDKP